MKIKSVNKHTKGSKFRPPQKKKIYIYKQLNGNCITSKNIR